MIMTSETIKLNLIPGGELPVLHSSQFDSGRALTFEIYDGEELFTSFDAYDISLHARKVDGTIIGIDTYNVDSENNQVIFFTTEQLTACAGKNICELVFTDSISGSVVGSCNFWLEVEGDPYSGGIDSASDIENLSTQIASIVDGQLNNYYTKEEIDDQIETIVTEQVTPIVSGIVSEQVPPIVESELSNYYTKSETDSAFYNKGQVDTLLSGKADISDLPDMTNYYDKTTTDTLLASKANTSTTYTKTEVDNLIAAIPSNDITTEIDIPAPIQTFNDGGDNIPLKSCVVNIPANAGGVSSVNMGVNGKNFYPVKVGRDLFADNRSASHTTTDDILTITMDSQNNSGVYGGTGTAANNTICQTIKKFSGNFVLSLYAKASADNKDVYFGFQSFYNTVATLNTSWQRVEIPMTLDGVIHTLNFYNRSGSAITVDIKDVQIEIGETATVYENYVGDNYSISLGETLTQGGTLEAVNGLLTRTDTTTSQLTGENILTVSGVNNVYADCGDIQSLEYFNNKADDIAAMISLMTRS